MNNERIRILFLLPLVLFASACGESAGEARWTGTMEELPSGTVVVKNRAVGMWGDDDGWRVVEELRIGALESAGPEQFGQVRALEMDAFGRIFVLDSQAKEVRVFSGNGDHIRTFGREGGGPGEFAEPSALLWGPDGNLWVVDQRNSRFAVFDTAGTFLTSHPRPSGIVTIPWPGGVDAEGNLYDVAISPARFPEPPRFSLARFNASLQPTDTLTLPQQRTETFQLRSANRIMAMAVPFAPRLAWRLSPAGDVWMGTTDRYRLNKVTFEGDTLRIVEREFAPVEVTAADRAEALEGLAGFVEQGGTINERKIPAIKPAFRQFSVDSDGYLWVRPSAVSEEEDRLFDVFDPEGRYHGEVRSDMPIAPDAPFLVRGNTVLAVTQDELGVAYVIRARIEGRE